MKSMQRREFVKSLSVGAGVAALSAAAATAPGNANAAGAKKTRRLNKKPLKIGVMTYTLAKEWDIATIIKNLGETGYQSVELRTTHAHGVEVSLTKAQRAEVKKRFEDSPLESISLASAFQYHMPDQAELKKNIEGTKEFTLLARDVGAKGIRVFPNAIPQEVPEEKTFAQIGKAAAEVAAFAADYDVQIRLAEHGRGTNRIPVIKKILDYAQSPHLKVNWNCDKSVTEGKGLDYNFNSVKDQIGNLHLHELWEPDYPYRRLFELLSESGYEGYCHAEIKGSEDPIRLMRYYKSLFLALQNAY